MNSTRPASSGGGGTGGPQMTFTWQPPFRVNLACVPLVCSFRRAEMAPAPAPDSQPRVWGGR
jgi:hypothetical protein